VVRTDQDVRQHLERYRIPAQVVYPGVPTPTVEDAAAAVGVTTDRILKSLVFLANGDPYLVVAAGIQPVDTRLLRAALGVPKRRLRFASAAEALELTGFEVGSMPPFAHARALPTLVDAESVPRDGDLYAGGGIKDALLQLSFETLVKHTNARLVPLTASREQHGS